MWTGAPPMPYTDTTAAPKGLCQGLKRLETPGTSGHLVLGPYPRKS